MFFIHQKMENDFSGVGLSDIVEVTTQCVHLFFNQSIGNGSIPLFENFTQLFSFVLGETVSNVTSWITLLVSIILDISCTVAESEPVKSRLDHNYGLFIGHLQSLVMVSRHLGSQPRLISTENHRDLCLVSTSISVSSYWSRLVFATPCLQNIF